MSGDEHPATSREAAAARAALRAFVRTHHPDVGGDPEVFVAGLAELRDAERRAARSTTGQHGDRRSTPADRGDAPIIGVTRPRGVLGLVRRLCAWRARKKRPPRVV